MIKKNDLLKNSAKYMRWFTLLIAVMAVNTYCFNVYGEPELPMDMK